MTFYLTSIDTFSLSRTVTEIFDFEVFRVRPWPLTPNVTLESHGRSKMYLPFESPYITSYLTSIDTFYLSRTVPEIFDIKVVRVRLWLSTLKSHVRSNIFSVFESPYMTFCLTSIDTFSLSRTVPETFDFKVFRVWPWLSTLKGHVRSKKFSPFESPYMTSYITSIDTFSLSRTVFEKNRVEVLKAAQNGGISPFQGQGHQPIFFISKKGSNSRQTASIDISRVKIGSAVLAVPSSKSVKSKKKRTNPYILGICTSVPENLSETKFW